MTNPWEFTLANKTIDLRLAGKAQFVDHWQFWLEPEMFASITLVLADLYWLPIKYHIECKILLLTFKIINSQNHTAPSYLVELLRPYTPGRALRLSAQLPLVQARSRLKTRGDRAFALVAPELWNILPIAIHASNSIQTFKSQLKTHLFNLAFPIS